MARAANYRLRAAGAILGAQMTWDPLQELIGVEKVWSLALSGRACNGCEPTRLSSRPEEFHLRALPEPCMTLSSHTAPDVRPLP